MEHSYGRRGIGRGTRDGSEVATRRMATKDGERVGIRMWWWWQRMPRAAKGRLCGDPRGWETVRLRTLHARPPLKIPQPRDYGIRHGLLYARRWWTTLCELIIFSIQYSVYKR